MPQRGERMASLSPLAMTNLERDDFSSNRHPALSFCLSMISAQTLRVCREGKPVPTFPDHALRSSCALGRREHHSVVGPAVAVGEHAADRMISFHVHAHGVAIPQLVADMEMDAFAHDELPFGLHVDGFPHLALHRPWRVGKPRHRDLCRGRQFQAEIAGLADLGRKVAAGIMHRMRQRLVCYVDHELLMMLDVDQRVLDAAVGPPADGEHAERRILAKHVEEAEGRGVDHAPGSNRRYPGDRPRQDESCQQLVAIARGEIVSGVFHAGIPLWTGILHLGTLASEYAEAPPPQPSPASDPQAGEGARQCLLSDLNSTMAMMQGTSVWSTCRSPCGALGSLSRLRGRVGVGARPGDSW